MVVHYNQDLFDSIIDSLLEAKENCSFYSAIYNEVNKRLSKKRRKDVSISYRDFSLHLDNLVKENRLQRKENPEKRRGTRVGYCLTDRAKKECQWNILGIDPKKERIRRLYQLLFFFESSKNTIYVTDLEFDEFLSDIKASRQELAVESGNAFPQGGPSTTCYKPIRDIDIIKFFDGYKVFYTIRLPGFSVEEILNCEKPTLRNFDSSMFCHYEFTHKELNDAINLFRRTGLIRPIPPIISGQLRFALADESIRKLILRIWKIHRQELGILYSELFIFGKPLTDIDRNKFLLFYGKEGLSKLNLYAHHTKQVMTKEFAGKRAKKIRELNELTKKWINEQIGRLKNEYEPALQDYPFLSNVIEMVCFR